MALVSSNKAKNKYNQFYKSIGFERRGLFELLKAEFNPATVMYPGCSIHVTPSFYFSRVIYVDKSQTSADFFSNKETVTSFIIENKTYKSDPYWIFLQKDFQSDLELEHNSCDLMISLFSGKLVAYCEKYVKPAGMILTSSLFSDNEAIENRSDFKLLAQIDRKKSTYRLGTSVTPKPRSRSTLRSGNNGLEYVDNETYYLYQKATKNKKE